MLGWDVINTFLDLYAVFYNQITLKNCIINTKKHKGASPASYAKQARINRPNETCYNL